MSAPNVSQHDASSSDPATTTADLAARLRQAGCGYGTLTLDDGPAGPETVVIARCEEERVTVTRPGTGAQVVRDALAAAVDELGLGNHRAASADSSP